MNLLYIIVCFMYASLLVKFYGPYQYQLSVAKKSV